MTRELLRKLFLLLLMVSCSTKENKHKSTTDARNQSAQSEEVFNTGSKDSFSFIGFVQYFYPTNEPYIELYFKNDNIGYEDYKKISETGDSIIYKDDENTRTRIPAEIVLKHFDLSGLQILSLFDKNNKLLSKARIKRIEYLDQNISSSFIAILKTDVPIKDAVYCIGNVKAPLSSIDYDEIKDTPLTNLLSKEFNFPEIDATHYKRHDTNELITIVNSQENSYIIEKKLNDGFKILYKSTESEHISSAIFIPKIINNKPVILTHCIMPEGDMEWSNLLIYDGLKYKPANRQRIK